MNLILIANIITCAGALGGFIFGAVRFFRAKAAVYPQMITLASGVAACGRLYQIIRIATISDMLEHFHLGVLAVIGSMLFLFSANFGQMDSLVDDGSATMRKSRIIPLAVPVALTAVYLALFPFSNLDTENKIIAGIVFAAIGAASYFNVKHLIIPDVEFGVIRCLRQYNLMALIYEVLCVFEMIAQSRELTVGVIVVDIMMAAALPLIILLLDRGVRKWST